MLSKSASKQPGSNAAGTSHDQSQAISSEPSTPKSPQNESPRKNEGRAALAKALEKDFKRKHLSVVGVLLWIFFVHVVGIYYFAKGFLLTRLVLDNKSSCDVVPLDVVTSSGNSQEGCWHPKTFDKAVFLIIDALRYDFTVPFHPQFEGDEARIYHNNIPVLYETAVQHPERAFLLPFIADPPTTTLQRLKGLTTGTLPTFIDAGSNFDGSAIDEDNIIFQLRAAGKNLVHLGDDTWDKLFPDYFDPELSHPFDSFNVWDLHTVDNGVNDNLFPLLHPKNSTKWDVIFGHYLGVDHAGHRYGPDHAAMAAKLKQMDQVLRNVIEKIDDDTLLIVIGDHGMDSKGDHGGESDDEVEAALWMYSRKGIFGRTNSDYKIPPSTAKERAIPQIDIVPTLSLLLGIPIPFNNLGSPIEEAFAGRYGADIKNLATVNRITSGQIKRYQHHYSVARGVNDSQTSGPLSLLAQAESQWQSLSKLSSNSDKYRAAYDAYREYQRDTLNVCRALWARFDVASMIRGIGILVAGIVVLIMYARGLREDRRITFDSQLICRIGFGMVCGAAGGLVMGLTGSREDALWADVIVLAAAGGSIGAVAASIVIFPSNFKSPLPKSLWSWFAVIVTVSQSIGFASNSYTIWEDDILLFFLTTFGVLAGISSMRQKSTSDRVLGVYHSMIFIFMARLASFSRLCREEQMPFCKSTYYASASSSTSAPWQLAIPFAVALLLPGVVRSFYVGSKSYEGSATLWIGVAFRVGLFISAAFWALDTADNGEWFSFRKEAFKSVEVILAQLVLAIAFAAGTTTFIWAKPCISINVTSGADQAGNVQQLQQQRTTITILGFGNVHGTRFFLLVVNFVLSITLLSKPMGQGAIAIETLQILSLLEILDTNGLTTTNSAIGPIVLGLLGSFHYFKTGHQATLNSIQWESAFFALSSIQYPWSPLLVIMNTFGAQILAAIAVPLTVLWKRPVDTHGRLPMQLFQEDDNPSSSSSDNKDSGTTKTNSPMLHLLSEVVQSVSTHILYYATINLATTLWAGHLRRHLMLYRIFCPRFMMGAAVLVVVDVFVILVGLGLGVRVNTLSVTEVFGW
ncbi:phosphoethanolamine N-methyltransferase, putative [Talaromyces stipitatus ATCC 10500]|uniref:Phosphoethanolamine N-methyltransferase, putative n=1 Tax=Talaromyces stipitatus (strain ATCC 10500 / CBS 375.48 / QM 6759 / NRRL 1006) TaxID=441959 RepID=B8M6E1_TALSN|nr:phosphoethanolamine N-methyltransferase, putative [Talaromyces stipitatus ATCC 10500]EED19316.1 phosphoethanolamine N-methyltransferase, putative [Talaromyces stipitatus ATCC 10500]